MMATMRSAYVVGEDPARLLPFYTALLGEPAFSDGNKWIQFPRETGRFAISSREEAATAEVRSVIVFEVQDLDATLVAAVRTGGRVVDERDMGDHGRTLTVADPAGNIVQFFQAAAGKTP